MKPLNTTPTREDVLNAFTLESDNDQVTLDRYIREYPQYAEDLTELSLEFTKPVVVSTAPLEAEVHAKIDAAWKNFDAASNINSPISILSLDTKTLRAIAGGFGIPTQVISALREGRVILSTIPRTFLERLAEAVNARVDELLEDLTRAGAGGTPARSYKSEDKPSSVTKIPFEQVLVEACVSAEKRALIMEGNT